MIAYSPNIPNTINTYMYIYINMCGYVCMCVYSIEYLTYPIQIPNNTPHANNTSHMPTHTYV